MLSAQSASRFVATAINVARQSAGNLGMITNKNILNVAVKDRTRKYGGRTEDQILAEYTPKMRRTDTDGSFESVIGDEEEPLLRMVYF